jgi:pimeloyl-ACP methyl ester carboxylesterase
MNDNPTVTRIDLEDMRSKKALHAEQRLFAHYGLTYKVHFIELNEPNLRIRILEVGEGPPLMLVPGGTGDVGLGAGLMSALKGWRIIAINRPGGGLSDGVDHRQIDVRYLALKTLGSVVETFGLDNFPIVGGSMGGLWAFWYALDSPQRISKIVQLGCPGFILNTGVPVFMRLLGVPGLNRLVAPNLQPRSAADAIEVLRFQGSSQEDRDKMPEAFGEAAYRLFQLPTYLDTWISMISAFTTLLGSKPKYQFGADKLKMLQQPVQFIWGVNDPFGDLEVAHQAARITPNAKLHELATGHLPLFDKPQVTGSLIREFLLNENQI